MKLIEGKKEVWDEIVERESQTPESRKELRFVMQWVALMEMEAERGISVSICARKTLVNMSNQFIGGGCDISKWTEILRDIWIYGEDFWNWDHSDHTVTVFYKEAQSKFTQGEVVVSKHARKRIHERCGLGRKAGQKLADRAMKEGLRIEDTSGVIRSYLAHVFYNTEDHPEIRLLDNHVFVFQKCENTYLLITVMQMPIKYMKYQEKEIKKEVCYK